MKVWTQFQRSLINLETYDVTTVRASTPTYLLRCKMVLSGKGSDESSCGMTLLYLLLDTLFPPGYPFFYAAPDNASFHKKPFVV